VSELSLRIVAAWRWLREQVTGWSPGGAGGDAERLAARWLRREHGFVVVARNWRNPRNRRQEIDLVCRDGEILVFVEVKARAADALVPGYFAVNERKKRVLRHAVRMYLGGLRVRPHTYRFDIVEVELPVNQKAQPVVRHFENVPLFRGRRG
jgi:putative endonuclease